MKYLKLIAKLAGLVVGLYLLASIGFFIFQDKFIFQPDVLDRGYVFEFDEPNEEFFIPMSDGVEVNALLFKTSQPQKGLILYFHGNADNLQRWGQYAADLTPFGYDVLMMDYRGYGKSGGKPNELDFYKDALSLLEWSMKNLDYDNLIIYGRSLGTTVASNLAITANPEWLILETPFDEIKSLVPAIFKPLLVLFPKQHRFSNKDHLTKVTCNVMVIHGTDDWVIPLASAMQLKPLLKEEDDFVVVEGGSHKNLREYVTYLKALERVLK